MARRLSAQKGASAGRAADGFVDLYRRQRAPSPAELLAELKNTAFTCASLNAAVCASYPPRLFVASEADQPPPRCRARTLEPAEETRLRRRKDPPCRLTRAAKIEEVVDHPLLALLQQVNPVLNQFDLFELTTLYQEVHGSAYWYLRPGPLEVPAEIWILPSQHVTPRRAADSRAVVDYYEYRGGGTEQRFAPRQIIHFRYPDPREPYLAGLSPLRAAYENVALTSEYLAFKKATWENSAVPSAVISPSEVLADEERDRLEEQWNRKYRRGGAGRVLVAESGVRVQVLSHSLGDLAALADYRLTKEDIANAFQVPLSFLTAQTNLANLQAAEHQHLAKAILPRLRRRDQKLNEQLVPLFDPTGRLFLASPDPVPANRDHELKQLTVYLKYGVLSINEVRQQQGLPPAPWGDRPWGQNDSVAGASG
jgi:HK97 family phage portal protein